MDRQLLIAKKETTYGTDAAPASIDTLRAENVRYGLKGQMVETDPAKPGVGAAPSFVYGEHVELSFDIPLAAGGVAGTAPKWGKLLKACGWGETIVATTSVTYGLLTDPTSSDSFTFIWRDAKRLHKILGARGKVDFKLTAGQRPMLTFTFRGLYVPVTAGAALVPADATFTDWVESRPIAQGRTTFSFGGVQMPLRDLSVSAGDNVVFADLPHQENVQLLGERAYTGKIKASMPAVGTFSPETHWLSRARQAFTLAHETAAGSIVTLSGGGEIGEPSYSREQGEDVFECPIRLLGSTLAASDDIAIVLT